MLPVERIIGEEGLEATERGARLAMRLPWYRSLPFSVVEVASLTLDGADIDLTDAVVVFDDQSFPLSAMGEQTNAFWFVRDSAFLLLPHVAVKADDSHEVSLVIKISPPYIPGMTRVNPMTATLTVA
jgi:hypothetical protein